MTYISDVTGLPLNPRPGYTAMIIAGNPVALGRIVSMSDDRRIARVVWRGTPGTYRFQPDPAVSDTGYIVEGVAIIRQTGKCDLNLGPGTLIEFPRDPFDMEIVEPLLKVSFLYSAAGLKVEVEPL
jgi:uncharacterized cupin superfamily protein